jgi:hypothetical protein
MADWRTKLSSKEGDRMQSWNKRCLIIVLGGALLGSWRTAAQELEPPRDEASQRAAVTGIVIDRPFSAVRYSRRVRIMPDGKPKFIKNERYPVQLGRDGDGRVLLQAVEVSPECDQPLMKKPPPCPVWAVEVLDLAAKTAIHWLEGEIAHRTAIAIPLTQSQVDASIISTSSMPEYPPSFDKEAANVSTTNLGEKVIDGVRASGFRTTAIFPAGRIGNANPVTRIHEVWRSADLVLVVRVVDGDPLGYETISGLENISLQPAPSIFQPPPGYEVQRRTSFDFGDMDVQRIADWFP